MTARPPANGPQVLAEGIEDLQVAFACDLNADGVLTEGPDKATDEWTLNDPTDVIATSNAAKCNQPSAVRLTLVARSLTEDNGIDATLTDNGRPAIENHPVHTPDNNFTTGRDQFRRRGHDHHCVSAQQLRRGAMKTDDSSTQPSLRRPETGAVLVVVLLAMIALLGMGLTGLYLTSGSIQMSSNINMRNQALYVAEAGIQAAKNLLNRTVAGFPGMPLNLNGMLAGTSPVSHPHRPALGRRREIPADKAQRLFWAGTLPAPSAGRFCGRARSGVPN